MSEKGQNWLLYYLILLKKLKKKITGIYLISYVVLVSGVQQSDSVIHTHTHTHTHSQTWTSLVTQWVKNLPAMQGDAGLIPESGRSPGGGHGNPLQYSCLENLIDRGTWQTTAHRVAKIWTQLKQLSRLHAEHAQ